MVYQERHPSNAAVSGQIRSWQARNLWSDVQGAHDWRSTGFGGEATVRASRMDEKIGTTAWFAVSEREFCETIAMYGALRDYIFSDTT
jgi:hypothetical protein